MVGGKDGNHHKIGKIKNKIYDYRNRTKKYRPGADYIAPGGQEYTIKQSGSMWIIQRYQGGRLHRSLKTRFTNFDLAEQALISFLRQKDVTGAARYPGKPSTYGAFNG